MSWRTVVLTNESKISLRLNHLVIKNERVTRIPLSEIGQLVIDNPNIIMTGHILNALSKHKIMTVICDEKHLPFTHVNLVFGNFRQPRVIKQQLSWDTTRKNCLWKYIVQHKIKNQKFVLESLNPLNNFSNFDSYIEDVQPNDNTNREGHAAKVYFNKLFGMGFVRGADTPQNWALNYGYSLLMSLFTKTIITRGLLTEVGIHHHSQFNHYNLSSDFMEVYRPIIDQLVKQNINSEFGTSGKRTLLEVFNKKVLIKQKKQFLANSIDIYVDSLMKYLNYEYQSSDLAFPCL